MDGISKITVVTCTVHVSFISNSFEYVNYLVLVSLYQYSYEYINLLVLNSTVHVLYM